MSAVPLKSSYPLQPLWTVVSLNDSVLPESTPDDFVLQYADISSVSYENGIETVKALRFSDAPSRARRVARNGDVIVSTVRTYLKAIAEVRNPPENFVVSTGFAVLRPKPGLLPRFLAYLAKSDDFCAEVESRSVGVSYPAIGPQEVSRIKVPVPSERVQNQISEFLDRETGEIDDLIEKQERLIAMLEEKRQAFISHAVTKGLDPTVPMKDSGIPWLGEIPSHWSITKLKYVKSPERNAFVDGPFGSNLKSEHFIDGGEVFVIESNFATQRRLCEAGLKTIALEHFYTISRSEVKEGDIVIAKIGAQFGKSCILPSISARAVVSGNSLKLTTNPKVILTEFAYQMLTHLKAIGVIDLLSNGSAQPALSLGDLNQLCFPLPDLIEQSKLVSRVASELATLRTMESEARRSIMLLVERRATLIAAAVTGKIDVAGRV